MANARKTSPKPAATRASVTAVEPAPAVLQETIEASAEETVEAVIEETVAAQIDISAEKVAELHEQLRHAAEESLEKSKQIYARAREAAEDASASLETSLKVATQGLTAFQVKTVEALQASADVQFAFVKALFGTKSITDVIVLQGEHARQQFETLNAAAKDISNLIQKVSTETVEPIKSAISKSLKIAA